MSRSLTCLAACALLALAVAFPAAADDDDTTAPPPDAPAKANDLLPRRADGTLIPYAPQRKSYREHLKDIQEHQRLRPIRALYAAIHALTVNPDGHEAYVELRRAWPDESTLLLREALRRNPDKRAALWPYLRDAFARPPAVKKFGTARRLVALYLGRDNSDLSFERDRRPSVAVGDVLDMRRLVVQGLDEGGDIVPIDAVYEAKDGLEVQRKGNQVRIVATKASARATLIIRDRKSGQAVSTAVRVCGPVHRIDVRVSRSQGKTVLGPGEMLHMRTRLSDEVGNQLWVGRLAWTVRGEKDQRLDGLLGRRYSWMHFDVTFEPHVQTLYAIKGKAPRYVGPVTVAAIDPLSGARGEVAVELIAGEEQVDQQRTYGGLAWRDDLPKAQAEAKQAGKPYFIYWHATW